MRALVTGAGGAIGAEIVQQLLEAGYEVIAQDISSKGLEKVKTKGVTTIAGDLLNEEDRKRLSDTWSGDSLDCVIAAHGVPGAGALEDLNPSFVKKVMDVNGLTIPILFDLTESALEKTGGSFVVLASQASLRGEASNIAYCAAKFAVKGWVEAMAPVMKKKGIGVRALCPGCTVTPLFYDAQSRFAEAKGVSLEDFLAEWKEGIPVGRFGEVEETAAAAVYLANKNLAIPTVLAVTGGDQLY